MKKFYIASVFILITVLAIADIMSENGIAGRTGSPGEFDCTGCHTSFTVNSGTGSISISSPTLAPNWEYIPGQVYQIDVTIAQVGSPLFGFGFEALRTSNNTNGGALSNLPAPNQTQLKNANINGSNRTNVVHKQNAGLSADSHTFSFNWTAPATNIGNIMFYTAGNASDNQGDSLGDYIYKTSQLITPFTTGLSNGSAYEAIKVFPNPASHFINVTLPYSSSICDLQLFNVDGRLIFDERKSGVKAHQSVTLHLPLQLPNGVYFLKATTESNKNFTAKVFVSN